MYKVIKIWHEEIEPKMVYAVAFLITICILLDNKSCCINYIFLAVCSLPLFIYAYTLKRNTGKFKKYKIHIMIMSMFICMIILSSVRNNTFVFIFYFIIADDIFDNYYKPNVKWGLVFLHFLIIISAFVIRIFLFENSSPLNGLKTIFYLIIVYALILLEYITIHNIKSEKDELKVLNCKLVEYSFKEREYLISEERSRISQELHDSLGHILMALSMNVRYAKAVKDKNKAQDELDEIESLVDESIKTLRSTVYSLKKLDENCNLNSEIRKIISEFNDLNMIKINFDYDNEIEKVSNTIKNIILVTVKEAVTNSLKHGNASVIDVVIKIKENDIELKIKDNGIGCKYINKSNGLLGISNRFEKVHGKVYFISKENKGFAIEASIPVKIEGEMQHD